MDNKSANTTTAPAAPQPAAAAQSMPAQVPVPAQTQPIPTPPMPMPAAPQMSSGGVTGSVNDFFRGVNWVDVGILMLGTAALYYTIYYYRIKIKAQKRELADMGNKVDMMEAKVSAIQKQQQEQNQSRTRKRRPVSF